MRIRDAEYEDAEAIERIRIRGWQAAYRDIYPAEMLDGLEVDWSRWQKRLKTVPAGWSILVAEGALPELCSASYKPCHLHYKVVGFASSGPSRDEEEIGELYALYVDPDSWSRGAGRALLGAAEERLGTSYREATLWVLAGNVRGRRFYERAGWQPDGTEAPIEYGGFAPAGVRYRKLLSTSASRG